MASIGEPADVGAAAAARAVAITANVYSRDTSPAQTYETTIIGGKGVPSMRFESVPTRALEQILGRRAASPSTITATFLPTATPTAPNHAAEFLQALGLAQHEMRPFYPTELPAALFECMADGRRPQGDRTSWSGADVALFEFAEYLSFEDLIPFEMSAQQSRSLAKLMVQGSGAGTILGAAAGGAKVGAAGGLVIGAPTGPLVFVTAAAGCVIGGAVGAVTAIVGEKLYDRLHG